jgi:fructokinase
VTSPVLCIGEALWDCLPSGLFLGGAPLNVAFHLNQLGRSVSVVSAVGDDFLGDELRRRLRSWAIDDHLLTVNQQPTGVVQVTLSNGQPSYDIVEPAAWDMIADSPALRTAVATSPAIVYGSLAARGTDNRELLTTLLTDTTALRLCDLNLRAPYDDHQRAWHLASLADVVKLNDGELRDLLDDPDISLEDGAHRLHERCGCSRVCITAGADGAGLLDTTGWHWADAPTVTVADTVGAGDSFTAALVDGLLHHHAPTTILAQAVKLAAVVASSHGATPAHPS